MGLTVVWTTSCLPPFKPGMISVCLSLILFALPY